MWKPRTAITIITGQSFLVYRSQPPPSRMTNETSMKILMPLLKLSVLSMTLE